MWEYNRKEIVSKNPSEFISELNLLGADGWEIIHYLETKPKKFGADWNIIVLLKREIKNP